MDLFFPPICGICGKLNKDGLCNKCKIQLEKVAENDILKQDLEDIYIKELIYIFKYEGIIRKLILDYKFHEKTYMYVCFVNFVLKNEKLALEKYRYKEKV